MALAERQDPVKRRQRPPGQLHRQQRYRKWFQGLAVLVSNSYLAGFFRGTIYQGPLKKICLPGLNCYSCPGALGACPLGSLQNSLADPGQRISFYVLGFLTVTGGLLGRAVCGWLCPFGWFQELLHRLPGRKLRPERRPRLHRSLLAGKFGILVIFVVLLPFGPTLWGRFGEPYFCKLICPSGTLMAGLPLLAMNADLRSLAGWLFGWKGLLLAIVVTLSIFISRPFCRYACPLGALYGFFNRISLYRVTVDPVRCTNCGICTRHCPMAVPVPADPNGAECIRCGECAAVCPHQAIHCGIKNGAASRPALSAPSGSQDRHGL